MASLATEPRFGFGKNWWAFVQILDEERVAAAEESLARMLEEPLAGRTFLDAGCGSGLFSLAATRLGARRVHAFDYDRDSVACAETLRARYASEADWVVQEGDVTDADFMRQLGTFDVVYSWGVLHHTGAMWQAFANVCDTVAPGGQLFVSIYNDQGSTSARWRAVKRLYNALPQALRTPYVGLVMASREIPALVRAVAHGRLLGYLRSWTTSRERGMSKWHDWVDWVGGYPFEVAKPERVLDFCRERGFELVRLTTCGGGLGCNEFVFVRR